MDICITSGSKGGTGKTTFSFILSHVLNYIYKKDVYIINLSKISYNLKTNINIVFEANGAPLRLFDFPAFGLTDRVLLDYYLSCRNVVFVADEDPQTIEIAKTYLKIARGDKLGILINMIIGKPKLKYLISYRRFGKVYLIPFDRELRIYRAEGLDPIKVRSPGVVKMIRAAVDIAKKIK